jgi:hypothetical protein
LSESGTREPRGRSEVDEVYRANAIGVLKNVRAVRAAYFYEACPSAIRADATASKTPARHPSQCSDPEFRCSVGDVSSTIASSALPPGRLIVRVLSGGVRSLKGNATPRRALISSASLARGKKQLREANGRHRSGRCSEGSGPSLMRIALERRRFVDRWQRPLRRP